MKKMKKDDFEIEVLKELPPIEELDSVEAIIYRKKDNTLIITKFLHDENKIFKTNHSRGRNKTPSK